MVKLLGDNSVSLLRKAVYGLVGNRAGVEFLEFYKMCATFDDILEEFDFLPGFGRNEHLIQEESAADLFSAGDDSAVSSETAKILEFLQQGEAAVDEISAALDLPASEITASLIGLELLHRVQKSGLKYRRIR